MLESGPTGVVNLTFQCMAKPPGNGKTITLKAMMKDAGVPVLYVKTFHSM